MINLEVVGPTEMKYNLNNPIHQQKFKEKVNEFYMSKEFVELKKVMPPRSNAQNSYLHLLIGWFALEYGETTEYVKDDLFKKKVNIAIFETEFVNRKTGECRKGWRSTRALDSKEMTMAIDRFRDWSSKEANIYLPQPNEHDYLKQVQIEMDKQRQYI